MATEAEFGGFYDDCYQTLNNILKDPTSADYESLMGYLAEVDITETDFRQLMVSLKYDEQFDWWYDSSGRTDLDGDLSDFIVFTEIMSDGMGLDCYWSTNILLLSGWESGGF